MAAKTSPVAKQIAGEVLALMERDGGPPEGSAAAVRLGRIDFAKLVPAIVSGLVEAAGIAADGHLTPEEAVRAATLVFELIKRLRREARPS